MTTEPLRIAFGGRMQVGKTTAADHLVRRHGFVKRALAGPIKGIARQSFDWDGVKDDRGRRLLQEIGTTGRHYDPDLWLRRFARWLAEEDPPRVAVDDLRLPREVAFLEDLGFATVRIVRPPGLVARTGDPARLRHETETGLDDVRLARRIDNDGTFEDLHARLDALVDDLREGR